jgi:hypothetical protein
MKRDRAEAQARARKQLAAGDASRASMNVVHTSSSRPLLRDDFVQVQQHAGDGRVRGQFAHSSFSSRWRFADRQQLLRGFGFALNSAGDDRTSRGALFSFSGDGRVAGRKAEPSR